MSFKIQCEDNILFCTIKCLDIKKKLNDIKIKGKGREREREREREKRERESEMMLFNKITICTSFN